MSSKKKSPTKNGKNSNKSKSKPKSKGGGGPKSKKNTSSQSSNKNTSNPSSNSNSFVYGFKVTSLSQANQRGSKQSPSSKKNKQKISTKNRNLKTKSSTSPFSTASSTSQSIELYTSSVTQLLDINHLSASSSTSLHDLQCGTGTIALQAFLSYTNLRRVFGIEQNKNLFHYATQNLMALIKNGYKNNKYLLVEQIPSNKMTIAQKSSESELENKIFKVGQIVYCYIPLKQNNIKKRDNYQGIIRNCYQDGIHFDVEMSATKSIAKKVHKESIFIPGTERTFEICRGNLFERSDSFRSDIILLPYSISNDSFKSLLLTGCKRSPIGSRILSFSHLESWDGFPALQLRRIDANIYDNDRYDTNLSPFHRLYLYSHVLSPSLGSPPKEVLQLNIGHDITVRDKTKMAEMTETKWFPAKVIAINENSKTITVNKERFILNRGIEEIKIDEQRIHILNRKFKLGDVVCSYCPKMIETGHSELYTLYNGCIVGVNSNGTYCVQFEDGETHPSVYEIYIFNTNILRKYNEGDICYTYRYDKITEYSDDGELINIKKKYNNSKNIEKGQCIIRHINADGTYRIEFIGINAQYLHDHFCESWLKPIHNNNNNDEKMNDNYMMDISSIIEPKLPLLYEIDYDKVLTWKSNMVSYWLSKCGINDKTCEILINNGVNGVFLFELDLSLLEADMGINKYDSIRILKYMKTLKHKLQYNISGDDESDLQSEIQLEIQEYDLKIKQIKLRVEDIKMKYDKLVSGHKDEYNRYKEWELKLQCRQLNNKKVSHKEISNQLKKNVKWVKNVIKLKQNQIKKPQGNIIKQFEQLQTQILKLNKQIKEKQTQMFNARQKLTQIEI